MKNITPAALKALNQGDIDNFIAASKPGGIEAQELEGQKSFVSSDVLPIDCPREKLEELGVVFGDFVDDLFVKVQLPAGWEKRPTDHSMWSELVDSNGKVIAEIFYKAAFYDRRADMRMT